MSIFKAASSNGTVSYFAHDFAAQAWCEEQAARGNVAGFDDTCCVQEYLAARRKLEDFCLQAGYCIEPTPEWVAGYLMSYQSSLGFAVDHYRGYIAILVLDAKTGVTEVYTIHR